MKNEKKLSLGSKPKDPSSFIVEHDKKMQALREEELLPWEKSSVRPDIKRIVNLHVSEPMYLKLKFIADNTAYSMQEFIRECIENRLNDTVNQILSKTLVVTNLSKDEK